ncbi:UDP-glucuronic acid decarboxylase family protein [Ilumatobacter sp.]|uniref:UDP-glucuronic acid decarboxylase family protein n=1 Tax=Ilumatobacter sp. TaxID=1967498 RepID=UPI003C57C7F3
MRIVVAGGAGFLGSHLCDALVERGDHVVCVDSFVTGSRANVAHLIRSEAFELLEADVCDGFSVDGEVDAVMNLASPASPTDYFRLPIETLDVGSVGTRNLLELARTADARFFMASTSEVYGDPTVHPQTEEYWGHVNPIGARSMYDEAKRFSEALTFAYHRTHGVPIRVVRIFNTYGPRMQADDGRVVSNFITQALRGEPLTIYGDGSQTRSFCYVDDEIAGFLALLDSDEIGPINIGNPGEFTMLELADIVNELTANTAGVVHRPLPSDDPRQRCPDITRAVEVLGWTPHVDLRAGLERTIAHFASVL